MDYELAAKFCELSHDATVRNNAKLVQIFIMTGKVPREPAAALLKVVPRNGSGRLGYLRKAWMMEKMDSVPEKKVEPTEIPAITKPAITAPDDGGGHLGGKPVPPFNTPAASEADYSKYQRTNTPETRTLPKPKPPVTRNKHNSSRYGNNNAIDSTPKSEETPSNQIVKHKQGNDILTVEIDRKEKKRSVDSGSDGGKMLRRRSLKNSFSAASGSSHDGEVKRRGSQENETTFSGHSRRYEAGDITRTFSTLNMGNSYAQPLARQTTSITEFDPPIPMPNSLGKQIPATAASFQRANTFIAQFSKSSTSVGGRRSIESRLAPSRSSPGPTNTHQWQPDFPQAVTPKNHNKFVPMQFRTQPVNLPGQLVRQRTVITSAPDLQPELLNTRSRTNISGFGSGRLSPQDMELASLPNSVTYSPNGDGRRRNQQNGDGQATVLTTVLAVGGGNSGQPSPPTHNGEHGMQSAR